MNKKHLVLIPTTLLTALLVLAFMAPSTARGALRALPGLHLQVGGLTADLVGQQDSRAAGSSGSPGASSQDSASGGSPSSPGGGPGVDAASGLIPPASPHLMATNTENCGRFGNGYHGGKHLLVCPNRPFPPPANH